MMIQALLRVTILWAALAVSNASIAATVDFEDFGLSPASFFNGDTGVLSPGQSTSVPWTSGGASFSNTFGIDNTYDPYIYSYWYGLAVSNVVDSTTAGFGNQYAAYPGGGFLSDTYAVAFGDTATMTFATPSSVAGFRIANTTYTFLTLLNGDEYGFTAPLPAGGWFLVTAEGSLGGTPTGSADFYLADLQGPSPPGLLAGWEWFDLSGLGPVDSISFSFSGSDVGTFGLNTPAYFAMDNVTYAPVPEPATWVLGVGAIVAAWALHRPRSMRAKP
jgi:hypothetical protein